VILARLVTAWFMQRYGTAGSHLSNNSILRGGVRSIFICTHAQIVRFTDECYFGCTTEQRIRRACHTKLPPSGSPSVRSQGKLRGEYLESNSCVLSFSLPRCSRSYHDFLKNIFLLKNHRIYEGTLHRCKQFIKICL
jgi:hypothetical protein